MCMKSLKKEHFYYGAILASIMEYNPDANFAWLQRNVESRKIYKIQTNNSKECIIFFKYAFEKAEGFKSWLFQLSDIEKGYLKECYEDKVPTFIYLLCGVKDLINSEIAVLTYDEFEKVSHKKNFTISNKKNYPNFYLHTNRYTDDDILIPRKRIEMTFDELIDEIIRTSNGYYCPNCGNIISRHCYNHH